MLNATGRFPALLLLVLGLPLVAGCPLYFGKHDRDESCSGRDCANLCYADGDCGAGNYCDVEAKRCVPSALCQSDAQCIESFWCDFRGSCVPRRAGACRTPNDCASGENCVEGSCRPSNSTCVFAFACAGGAHCLDNACTPACMNDEACGSGSRCVQGTCKPFFECMSSSQCQEGEYCNGGRCLSRCKKESDCDKEQDYCAEDGFCRPDWRPRCQGDATCPNGRCIEGACRTPCDDGSAATCRSFDQGLQYCAADKLCYPSAEDVLVPQCRSVRDCANASCYDGSCRTDL